MGVFTEVPRDSRSGYAIAEMNVDQRQIATGHLREHQCPTRRSGDADNLMAQVRYDRFQFVSDDWFIFGDQNLHHAPRAPLSHSATTYGRRRGSAGVRSSLVKNSGFDGVFLGVTDVRERAGQGPGELINVAISASRKLQALS